MKRPFILLVWLMVFWPLSPFAAEEKEGGIIGTGVIGQITALDQFAVSGMQFDFAPDMEIVGVRGLEDLRIGMTLVLGTGRNGADWQIHSLRHMPLLSGPVTAPGEIMGVPIVGDLPSAGSFQIDGFWTDSGIVASRIVASPDRTAQVSGTYNGRGMVGQVPVQSAELSAFSAGQTLTVRGIFQDGAIIANSVEEGAFDGPTPGLVLLEGAYQTTDATDLVSLQGIAFASSNAEESVGSEGLVRHCAWNGRTDFLRNTLSANEQEIVASFCISATN
ncbi:MAG: hypothetical protein AAGF55_15200 [Pseudomonadota bacterium]